MKVMTTVSHAYTSVAGVHIYESIHATAEPTAQPRTDDMRAMVEHMRQLGLIQRKPAAFETAAGLIVHPAIMAQLRARATRMFDDIYKRAFYGALK